MTLWGHKGNIWGHTGDNEDMWGVMETFEDTIGIYGGRMGANWGHDGDVG